MLLFLPLFLSCLLFSFSNCCLDFPLSFAAFSSFCRFKSSSTSVSVMQLAFAFTACFLVSSLVAIGFGIAKILLRMLAVISSQLEEDGADIGGLCAGGSPVGSGSLLSRIHCR